MLILLECHSVYLNTAPKYLSGLFVNKQSSRAEAVGSIYVKRLSDAVRDGNPIRAIIRGTSVNT